MKSTFKKIRRCAALVAIACIAMTGSIAFGQSLTIAKKQDKTYTVKATAPSDNPHALQGTANMHLWVDLNEEVAGSFSYDFDSSRLAEEYFRLKPSTPPADPIRVLLIGDSMSSDCCGWGIGMPQYFKDNVTFVNYATPWVSTKVFLQSAEWDKMLLIKPDYVLIQFAWMDESTDPDRSTTLPEFKENLRTIVEAVRSFNGVPILITLHAPRRFDASGHVLPSEESRNNAVREMSAELQTPLIDLYKLSKDLFNKLGPEGVDFMLHI
jgi:hypothetical protein